MGRNKPRSKAVDVTKSLLQPTSVTDHIAVQISPNVVIQVAEEDLSPTQGSEAAFALRREGKLDTTMKLCLNWRQGNCHNHAACSFAHVARYFGVMGDLPNPIASANRYSSASGSGTYSSVAAGGANARGGAAAVGTTGTSGNASWSQKLAPPSYTSTATRGDSARAEERKPAPAPPTPTVTAAAAPEEKAVATPTLAAATALEMAGERASQPRAAAQAEVAETAKDSSGAPPAPSSTAATTPQSRPSAADAAGPPAVLSAEGLRSILALLTAPAAAAGPAASREPAPAADDGVAADSGAKPAPPAEFLAEVVTSAVDALPAPWQHVQTTTDRDLLDLLGRQIIGDSFSHTKEPETIYAHACGYVSPMVDAPSSASSQPHSAAARSPGAEFAVPGGVAARSGGSPVMGPHRLFSTAPTAAAAAVMAAGAGSSSIGQLGGTGVLHLGGAHAGVMDDAHLPVSGLSYQQLLNSFTADE